MPSPADPQTSPTLLGRLRLAPTDQNAWQQFVQRYGPKIYGWCRGWGLQDADAEDVTQAVLLRLAVRIRDFEYDPSRSFRAWLMTISQHAWSDLVAARKNHFCRQRARGRGRGAARMRATPLRSSALFRRSPTSASPRSWTGPKR